MKETGMKSQPIADADRDITAVPATAPARAAGKAASGSAEKAPAAALQPAADWNAVESALLRRRSIRKYKYRQVPANLVRRVLEVARFAPSQGNCQPWKFVVVRDPEVLKRMEDFCVAECKRLSASLDYSNYRRGTLRYVLTRLKARLLNRLDPNLLHPVPVSAVAAIAQGRFTVFHHAPTVVLLLMDKRGVGSPEIDIGVVGSHIVMAAQSLGLGSCWVGFSKFLMGSKALKAQLGVEPPFEIAEAICLGYPMDNPGRNPIARQTHEILWWEDGRAASVY
jgi:nitroreductase